MMHIGLDKADGREGLSFRAQCRTSAAKLCLLDPPGKLRIRHCHKRGCDNRSPKARNCLGCSVIGRKNLKSMKHAKPLQGSTAKKWQL